jgi:hypothetical protein
MPIVINPLYDNPSILTPQEQNLVASKEMTRFFGLPEDFVQLFVYNNINTLVGNDPTFDFYSVTENKEINFDPAEDIERLGFRLGTYRMVYNFFRPLLTQNPNLDLFVKSISSDRKEIKIATTTDQDVFFSNAVAYIDLIQNRNYFIEYYLDFGNNIIHPALSMAAERDINGNVTVIIKLQNPLPETFVVNSPLNVVEKIVNTQEYQASLTSDIVTSQNNLPSLREANFSLDVDSFRIGSSDYYNYNQILNYTSSEFQNLLTFISSSNPTINVDYNNYENFIHFGSATQQLETFQYKLNQIEAYNANIISFPTSPDAIVYQQQLDSVIKSFDAYENFLYFESGSKSWPKYPGNKPYVNYSVTSSQGIAWYNLNYTSASYYDEFNNDNLIYGLPVYLQESPTFSKVAPFVYSMGQMFDDIWIYIRAITDLWKAENGLNQGISKDIVGDALQSLGIALYTDGDQDNIYEWLYGSNQSGTQTFVTQSWQTGITASQYTLSGQDEAKSVFKRIYANLPTLLKSKGTDRFINYLNTLYGIPDTILFPMEFGGIDKTSNTAEYNYSRFSAALQFQPFKYSFVDNLTTSSYGIQNIEFRFRPTNLNTSNNQTLLIGSNHITPSTAEWIIYLQPTSVNGYDYANVVLWTNSTNVTQSVLIPAFVTGSNKEYNWWNVAWQNEGTGSVLYVKNELNGEIGYNVSTSYSTPVYDSTNTRIELGSVNPLFSTTLPSSLSLGSCYSQLQELRGWSISLSESILNTHTLNPESYVGNTTNDAYDNLIFRFPLGNDLYTNFGNVTGSQPNLNSNYFLYFNGTWQPSDYVYFTEQYYTQPAVGGYSVPNTDKIRIESQTLATNRLQLAKSVVYNNPTSSRTNDIHLTQVGFSPQDQINNDIIAQLGTTYNLDQIIGDPRYSDLNYYPGLETLQEDYFEKYVSPYNYKDFIQLIETYHKSLFRYLETYIPGRANNASGVVIKPHILERSKTRRYEPTIDTASYDGQIETVTIVGSNSGDYCCSRNSTINEAFFDGELSGSYIEIWSAYDQNNPFTRAICDCHQYQVTTDGQIVWVDCNGETKVDSGITQRVVQLTACKDKITTVGSTNFYLQDLGRFSGGQAFIEQYEGWDALDNNVVPNVQSQFKFKKLPTSQSINTSALGNCARYKITNLGTQGGTPAQGDEDIYFNYTNCNGIGVLCDVVSSSPFPTFGPNFIYREAIVNSIGYDTLGLCGTNGPANNFQVDFDGYIRQVDNRIFTQFSSSIEWQDTNLSDAGYVKSREIGSSTTALDFNQTFSTTSSIVTYDTTFLGNNSLPNVEQTQEYILFVDTAENTLAERFGSTQYHIKLLIDNSGSIYKPEESASYFYNTDQNFGSDTPVAVAIYNGSGSFNQDFETTVYQPLKRFETIIHSDTGSYDSLFLKSGYIPTMSFTSIGGFLTNVETYIKNVPNGDYVPVNFEGIKYSTIIRDDAGGWNLSNYIYTAPKNFGSQIQITASVKYDNENAGQITGITTKLYKNGDILNGDYNRSIGGGQQATVQLKTITDYNEGDQFYVIYDCTDTANKREDLHIINGTSPNDTYFIITAGAGNTVPTVTSSYYFTSSFEGTVLTASTALSYFYGPGYVQTPVVSNGTGSGFKDPSPFTIEQYDQIRFGGNENEVYTIISSSIEEIYELQTTGSVSGSLTYVSASVASTGIGSFGVNGVTFNFTASVPLGGNTSTNIYIATSSFSNTTPTDYAFTASAVFNVSRSATLYSNTFAGITASNSTSVLIFKAGFVGEEYDAAVLNNYTFTSGSTTYNFSGASGISYASPLFLYLDRTPQGQNLDYFAIRRLATDPGYIILNNNPVKSKPGLAPAFILPKYMSPTLKNNLSNIISNLTAKGLFS